MGVKPSEWNFILVCSVSILVGLFIISCFFSKKNKREKKSIKDKFYVAPTDLSPHLKSFKESYLLDSSSVITISSGVLRDQQALEALKALLKVANIFILVKGQYSNPVDNINEIESFGVAKHVSIWISSLFFWNMEFW